MGNEHILVIEDGEFVRNLVQSHLEKVGYQVTTAGKISRALQEIRTRLPDIVILDLTLDEEDPFSGLNDGFAFLGMLRHGHPAPNPEVIIFSVNHTPEIEARAKSMGVHSVVSKKGGMRVLLTAVQAALEERKNKQTTPLEVDLPQPEPARGEV